MNRERILITLWTLTLITLPASAALTISGPDNAWPDLGDSTKEYAARAKADNTGWELAAGLDPGVPGQFQQAGVNWLDQPYEFTITYNAGQLTLDIAGTSVTETALNPADNLFIFVRATDSYTLSATDMDINGIALPDLSTIGGVQTITLTDVPAAYTLTGTLAGDLDATNANERVRFEIKGSSGPIVIPEPATLLLLTVGMLPLYSRRPK